MAFWFWLHLLMLSKVYRSNSFEFTGSLTTLSFSPLTDWYCCLAGSAWRQVWLLCWRKFALNQLFQAYGTPILKPVYRKTPHHRAHWGVILEATKGVPSAWRSLPFSETLIMRSEENIFFHDSPPYSAVEMQRTPALTQLCTKPAFYLSAVRT